MDAAVVPPDRSAAAAFAIRRAELRDLETIVALRRALRHEERPGTPFSDDELRAMTRRQLHSVTQTFVLAEAGDRVIGLLRCALQAPVDLVVSTAMITTAFVDPAFRRRGVMTQLVLAAEAWCAAQGVRDLRLRNAQDNPAASATWEALGFRVVQVVRQRPVRG